MLLVFTVRKACPRHQTPVYCFRSVCVVSEGNEDVLYAAIERTASNGTTIMHIERLRTRVFDEQMDAFFVDAGLTYRGAPVSAVSGLWHLEGKDVQILADGAVVTGKTVTNGTVTPNDFISADPQDGRSAA